MRKTLEILALLLLLFIWGVTVMAIYGPHPLAARIPTHFNALGQPDGWGTPSMLWVLPGIASLVYLLMSVVSRYPGSFSFPTRVPPGMRHRLEAIALNMIAWLKVEVMCLFAWIQYETVAFARRGQGRLSPVFLPLVLVAVFATVGWHIVAMRRVARVQ